VSIEALTLDGFKLVKATATGPSTNTTVNAGSAATLALPIQANPARLLAVEAVGSITGLPSGVVLAGFSATTSAVTLTVFNPTTSNVTVTANSVTATVLAKAL